MLPLFRLFNVIWAYGHLVQSHAQLESSGRFNNFTLPCDSI